MVYGLWFSAYVSIWSIGILVYWFIGVLVHLFVFMCLFVYFYVFIVCGCVCLWCMYYGLIVYCLLFIMNVFIA